MRKATLFFLLFTIFPFAQSQTLRGTVRNESTDSVIYGATIYFNSTSTGTFSDRNGHFELDISKYSHMPVTVSALGYYSVVLSDYSPDRYYRIYLAPKVYELNEVVVSARVGARRLKWRLNLNTFKKEFLGGTMNASSCEIENENDIVLTSDNIKLKAFTFNPLIIKNTSLGYEITYFLDKFEYDLTTNSLTILGNILFKDDTQLLNQKRKERIEKRRKTAYLGSRMQFFRALWQNNLDSTGFIVKNDANIILNYYNLVAETDSVQTGVPEKYLNYGGDLSVGYYSKLGNTVMEMTKDYVDFDRFGYFDPLGINWRGEMAKQRIGDLLPYEYIPK